MSQLFDSLRRRHRSVPAPAGQRNAPGDAVLTMLGYPRVQPGLNWSSLVATLTLVAGLAIAAFVGWRLYSESGSVTPATAPSNVTKPRR